MVSIHRAIGMGADQLLDHLLPDNRNRDEDGDLQAAHDALFSVYWSRLVPVPGAAELVRACKHGGLTTVFATSAGAAELSAMRVALDADDAVDDVTSADDVDRSKPAPDLVEVALDKSGVPAGQAVFVGDTVWDVRACQRAGVRCLAVLTGGVSRDELLDAGADAVFDSPADLLEHLDKTPLAAAAVQRA